MTFGFRDTPVYQLAKDFYKEMQTILQENDLGRIMNDQLKRASLSISLSIVEGYGRYHKADKKNFYITARASAYECVACLDVAFDSKIPETYLNMAEELAKMLSGLINRFQ